MGALAVVVGLGLVAVALVGGDDEGGSAPERATTTTTGATGPTATTGDPAGSVPAGSTAPTTPEAGLGEGVAPERGGRRALRGFGEVAATITAEDGTACEVCLLAATDAAQRERGLMEVTDPDLGGYDGMLFAYPEEVGGAFWMRNTPTPLSIAYFDAAGHLVSTADMAPCADEPTCRSYPADRPFRYAVEVPRGRLPDVGVVGAATLRIDARTCPQAPAG